MIYFLGKKYESCKHQSSNNLELTPHRFSFHLNHLIQFIVARLHVLLYLFNMCWVKESAATTVKGFRKWRFCLPCPSCSWLLCNFYSQEPALYKASSASAPSGVFQSPSSKDWLPMALLHCNSDIGSSTLFHFLSTAEQLVLSPLVPAFKMVKCRIKPQSPPNLVIRAILLSEVNHQLPKSKKELPRGVVQCTVQGTDRTFSHSCEKTMMPW